MPRELKRGFIREFCTYAEETEVPSIFAMWSAISAISAVLGRKCFVPLGHYKVHPNMYIVLVAGSARCHKSTAIDMAEKLIRGLDEPLNILSQKMTPEALIHSLSESPDLINGSLITETAEGIAIVDELSTLIDKNSFQK